MTKAEMLIYEDENLKPAKAVKTTSNFGGIEILDIFNGNEVVSCENYGKGRINFSKTKIYYSSTGDAYFLKDGRREKFAEYYKLQ